jgi:hypothetical protein
MTHSVVWLNHVGSDRSEDGSSSNEGVEEGDSLRKLRGSQTVGHVVTDTATCRRIWV